MRQPYNVLVLPYYKTQETIVYAVFKRADGAIYQGIAGGVEGNESFLEAAKRESFEEAKIDERSPYMTLDATASIPATVFGPLDQWQGIYVVKEIAFGVEVRSQEMTLSHEHHHYVWCTYEEAHKLLSFDSNKVALWELNERLKQE